MTLLCGLIVGVSLTVPVQAALIDRGGGFIYDTDLDVTWTQNANINGVADTWANQVAWADSLSLFDAVRNVTWSDWRLPTCLDNAVSSATCSTSEMGHLFFGEGISTANPGPFIGMQTLGYMSGTEYAPDGSRAWHFHFNSGVHGESDKSQQLLRLGRPYGRC